MLERVPAGTTSLTPWDNALVSHYQDPGIEQEMRESAERFERILGELRAGHLDLEPDWAEREARRAEYEREREADRAEVRELWARIKKLDDGGAAA